MQRLNSEYAQWFNKRHGRVGHVLQGRFKDQIVQKEGYLYTLCRYIVMNPVRAGLVNDPAEWPWSSYRATVGLAACPAFLSSRSVLNLFGDGELETLQTRFVKYVNEPHPEEENIIDRFRSKEVIIGDAAFKACVRAEAGWDDDARAVETAETALALSDASALSG